MKSKNMLSLNFIILCISLCVYLYTYDKINTHVAVFYTSSYSLVDCLHIYLEN